MKIEIEINRCRFCKFFVCISEDGMDFLNDDETKCRLRDISVTDDDSCDTFIIENDVLKEIKSTYGKKFVKVIE